MDLDVDQQMLLSEETAEAEIVPAIYSTMMSEQDPSVKHDDHRPILDSDSDLSDIEDPQSRKVRKRIIAPTDPSSDSELFSLSDACSSPGPSPPKKKKKRSSNTKKVDKGKGKAKVGDKVDGDESDEEFVVEEKGKRMLVAKEVFWGDMPDWKGREDCPLLELPVEVLDRVFAPSSGLELRDYISLAGTCSSIRDQMTDAVWESIGYAWPRFYQNRAPSQDVSRQAYRIMSHSVRDWYKEPAAIVPTKPLHYIPRGKRSTWTYHQWVVYKEEQSRWRVRHAREKLERCKEAAEAAAAIRSNLVKTAKDGAYNRTVRAEIMGRKNGELPVAKDANGMPILSITPTDQPINTTIDENLSGRPNSASINLTQSDSAETVPVPPKRKGRAPASSTGRDVKINIKNWSVPESEDEYESEPEVAFDLKGERVIHDHWPSAWRSRIADVVNTTTINKTAAKELGASDAELLCLKHVLVSNPMSSKQPKQLFIKAAVEALVLRSHGGVRGHADFMSERLQKSDKLKATRNAKIERQKADGTYVRKQDTCRCPYWTRRWAWWGIRCDACGFRIRGT